MKTLDVFNDICLAKTHLLTHFFKRLRELDYLNTKSDYLLLNILNW